MDKMKAWTWRLGTRSELLHLVYSIAALVAVLGRLQIVQPNVPVCFWQPIFTVGADEHSSRFFCTVAICWKKSLIFNWPFLVLEHQVLVLNVRETKPMIPYAE
ncbi:hypothetical protein VPH35_110205 [Triticum aestivum]